jgi:signal transduction histidine kinase
MNVNLFNNLDLFSVGLVVSAIVVLGFAVYFNDKESLTAKAFLYFAVITAGWGSVNYLNSPVQNPIVNLWLLRLVLFFAVWQAFTIFHFFYVFPSEKMKFSRLYKFVLVPLVFLASLVTLTPFVFPRLLMLSKPGSIAQAEVAPGILIFGFVAVSLVFASIAELIKKLFRADSQTKRALRIILIGTIITFALVITFNFLIPVITGNRSFIVYGSIFFFPFIGLAAYAMLREKLFHVRTIGTAILVILLSMVTFTEVILSSSLSLILYRSVEFILVLVFGILLVRGAIREVQQRELLAKANARLRELDELKSQFLSFASHQLRSPLTAIQGYTSMLLEGDFGEMSEPVKNSIKTVDQSSKSLITIVNEFLDVSRIEQGRMKYDISDFDIKKLAEEVFNELRPNVEKKGLKFEFLADNDAGCIVNADQGKIKQVIGNIIDNAIKYTETGGIKVQLEHKDKKVLIKVSDSGIGIEPSEITKLFSMFTRAADAHKTNVSGTGLGLYVAKQMVEAQKGRVWVESPGKGKGSTFFIELPLKA